MSAHTRRVVVLLALFIYVGIGFGIRRINDPVTTFSSYLIRFTSLTNLVIGFGLLGLLISFFLAATALTSPLLAKRDLYNIDGEPIPDFQMEIDKRGHIVPPADWPYYDSLDMQCQGHKNYVPRINVGKWKKECVSSMCLS